MKLRTLWAALIFSALGCAHPRAEPKAQHDHDGHDVHRHRFEDAEHWAKRFEDPERDAWQLPGKVVEALALAPDAKVADIGSATGYFPVRLARAVPQGKVYGVDIEPDMVRYLNERARREGLSNLVSVLGEPADPKLPEPVDLVLVVDTWHHIEARVGYFSRLKSHLAPRGRLAIIDFRKESPKGPPVEFKPRAQDIEAELKEAGYVLSARHDFLPDQNFLVFTAAP